MLNVFFKKYKLRKIKKEDERKILCNMETRNNELCDIWQNMLIKKKKIKVIKSNSEQEFEQKYSDFMCLLKNDGRGRLESICQMKEPKFIHDNGFFIYTLEYVDFSLRDGVAEKSYINVINEFDEFDLKYKCYRDKFHNDYD